MPLMNRRLLLARITRSQSNVRFEDFVNLVEGFGFELTRVRGSHRVYRRPAIPAQLHLQDRRGEAKSYQVRRFLRLIEEYNLKLEDEA